MGKGLQDEQMEALAQWAAAYWPMMQYLDLSGNKLGLAGVTDGVTRCTSRW
jgi:hypothetical protein